MLLSEYLSVYKFLYLTQSNAKKKVKCANRTPRRGKKNWQLKKFVLRPNLLGPGEKCRGGGTQHAIDRIMAF